MLIEKLGIKGEKDLENYSVIVVVPDMVDRRDLKARSCKHTHTRLRCLLQAIVQILVRDLRVKAFTFFQESVACAFAAGTVTRNSIRTYYVV